MSQPAYDAEGWAEVEYQQVISGIDQQAAYDAIGGR